LSVLLIASLAPATFSAYGNALSHYQQFHAVYYSNKPLLPILPAQLAQFITVCHHRPLQPSTITSYLPAISYIHNIHGLPNPRDSFILQKLMKNLRRHQSRDKRQPFTLDSLKGLVSTLKTQVATGYDRLLFRAMFLLAFFGLLRVGEIASSRQAIPNVILRENILVHRTNKIATSIAIHLHHFKHSRGRSATIHVSRQTLHRSICPVHAILRYLQHTKHVHGPLFIHEFGQPVFKSTFCSVLQSCV